MFYICSYMFIVFQDIWNHHKVLRDVLCNLSSAVFFKTPQFCPQPKASAFHHCRGEETPLTLEGTIVHIIPPGFQKGNSSTRKIAWKRGWYVSFRELYPSIFGHLGVIFGYYNPSCIVSGSGGMSGGRGPGDTFRSYLLLLWITQ